MIETIGQRIERILGGDDLYEKITELVFLIEEQVSLAVANAAVRENYADDALRVALEAANKRNDRLYTQYHEDLRRILDIWDGRIGQEKRIAQLELQLKKAGQTNRELRAKVRELKKVARPAHVREIA